MLEGLTNDCSEIRSSKWYKEHDQDSYVVPQNLARQLRNGGSEGLIYRSVRTLGHECVAAFRTTVVARGDNGVWAMQARHYRYI